MMFDLLIKNGHIIDGSGADGFDAHVGIKDGKITICNEDCEAKEVIDATGKHICPGFVDPHSHGDLVLGRVPGDWDVTTAAPPSMTAALFGAVEQWAAEKGCAQVHGPLGFTDFDPEGMLIEGFDRIGTMATIYNYPYYPKHMERMGYEKDADWQEYLLTAPAELPEKHARITRIVKEKFGLRVVKYTSHRKLAKERGVAIFELLNEAYAHLYGYSALSEKQIQQYIKAYLPLLDLRLVPLILDKDDNLVGFAVLPASLAKAFQKARGYMFPFGWWHLLKALKWNDTQTSEMLLIAVKPEYQGRGAVALLFADIIPIHYELGFRYSESNPELEVNTKIQSQWDYFERENHKRRRAFKKEL